MTSRSDRSFGELYIETMGIAAERIAAVRPDQWNNDTPCGEWDVRDVTNHLIYENLWAVELFAGKTIDEVGDRLEGDLTGDDPSAEFAKSFAAAQAAASAPGAMDATCHLSFGDFPGSEYAKQLFMDMFIHSWDIATGAEQDQTLDPELVTLCMPVAEEARERFGGSGAFGNDIRGESDNAQTQLLAILGREG
ncbi:MAG: TIGR03086 family protein [Chloroflexi bacterium]|jgi:uncharacterized protein (TIGR03086 family)|nr:TIGR03086 family protein [Chloroflexota bacterium]MBT4072099.1 TIGR03086 family protein [Chloroflexota bacterium]MBT4514271.1 TIGR03086 family protein [Chloroflexota bacterium]MBT5319145.1 TIGR03086 family protein [Chloroflexota bacterium]